MKFFLFLIVLYFSLIGSAFGQDTLFDANVGIGTTTPNFVLDIGKPAYDNYFNMRHVGGSPWGLYMGNSKEENSYGGSNYFSNINVGIDNADTVGLVFNHVGYNGGTTYFRNTIIADGKKNAITVFKGESGYVGIGTVNPQHKLDVLGTIRAREIQVDLNGADYVFQERYKLMPLDKVEEFIKKNRHLPGIPSAKKMEKGGMGLGDLQTKLLAKIEELTLHLIEQNKVIEKLKKKISKAGVIQ